MDASTICSWHAVRVGAQPHSLGLFSRLLTFIVPANPTCSIQRASLVTGVATPARL